MRGTGYRNAVAENLTTVLPLIHEAKKFGGKWKMCWSCQRDKSPVGGHIKAMPGLMKFICKDCLDKKKEGAA